MNFNQGKLNELANQSGFNELALFAGAGGGILGGHLLGWRTVCAVEWEPYPACVLAARQNDGILPPFPIWDDVQTFDGKPWRGIVDVVTGGFPCQDISSAGKGAGIEGSRSSMWKHMARIIGEVRPRFAFVENSPMLVGRGAAMVIGDLTEMGYDCQWCIVSASDCGAPHKRDRFWLVGNTNNYGQTSTKVSASTAQGSNCSETWQEQTSELEGSGQQHEAVADSNVQHGQRRSQSQQPASVGEESWNQSSGCGAKVADTTSQRLRREQRQEQERGRVRFAYSGEEMVDSTSERQQRQGQSWFGSDPAEAREGETDHAFAERVGHIWGIESPVGRVANGVAARVDRLKAVGNGQVPIVAATAFRILSGAAVK